MRNDEYDTKQDNEEFTLPPQHQSTQPGVEAEMFPRPEYISATYRGSDKLRGKVAIITGGDSGIGRAIAVHFAAEGADIVLNYLADEEEEDADETLDLIVGYGQKAIALQGDIGDETFCQWLVERTLEEFGQLDILVNNAAQQYPQQSIEDITQEQLECTFRTNIFSMFYTVKAALPFLNEGARIINTASITAYKGNEVLLDYSATKGAIVAFTRSLAQQLADKKIHVNAVAPGPIWTPLIPASFSAEKVKHFGQDTFFKRPGQPSEVAPAYVFLASNDGSYITGQVIHPNGGYIVNG